MQFDGPVVSSAITAFASLLLLRLEDRIPNDGKDTLHTKGCNANCQVLRLLSYFLLMYDADGRGDLSISIPDSSVGMIESRSSPIHRYVLRGMARCKRCRGPESNKSLYRFIAKHESWNAQC